MEKVKETNQLLLFGLGMATTLHHCVNSLFKITSRSQKRETPQPSQLVDKITKTSQFIFDENYQEEIWLQEGSCLRLRLIRPTDKHKLVDLFEHLSPQSRYRRFFAYKRELTEHELHLLTEVDGINHFALCAFMRQPDGSDGSEIGVARFVRLRDSNHIAEFAITVIDAMHGKHIGSLLCERLLAAAAERGITQFECYLLPDNKEMHDLVKHLYHEATFRREDHVLVVEFPVPSLESALTYCQQPPRSIRFKS